MGKKVKGLALRASPFLLIFIALTVLFQNTFLLVRAAYQTHEK